MLASRNRPRGSAARRSHRRRGRLAGGLRPQENADLDNGRKLFIEKCGTCHALTEAARRPTSGPTSTPPSAGARATGWTRTRSRASSRPRSRTRASPTPTTPAYMPARARQGQDADDVAAYVASVAGVPGIEPPIPPGRAGRPGVPRQRLQRAATRSRPPARPAPSGPNLDETLARQDAAEIEESIVDPDAEIAQGFADGIMPATYGETSIPQRPRATSSSSCSQRPAGKSSRPSAAQCVAPPLASASRSTTTWVTGRSTRLAGPLHDAALEPRRALRRVGGDDQLVGRRSAQRVLDRDVGVGVADRLPGPRARPPAIAATEASQALRRRPR